MPSCSFGPNMDLHSWWCWTSLVTSLFHLLCEWGGTGALLGRRLYFAVEDLTWPSHQTWRGRGYILARTLQAEVPPEQALQMRSFGNPTTSMMEKVLGQEDEEITKRGTTKQWPGLRDKLSGGILDLSRDCVQVSSTRETGVLGPVFLCLGQYRTAPVDTLSSDAFPPSLSWGQYSSRTQQGLAEGTVE